MNNPLVSILIPVYNTEKYVADAIESALNQTYKNIEIIIVDDGSTDKSWEIIESYRKKYPNIIKTYQQENKGAGAARNKAALNANGIYLQFLDSDDLLLPIAIEKKLDFKIKFDDYTVIFSNIASFNEQDKNKIFYNEPYHSNILSFNDAIFKYLVLTPTIFISKKLFIKMGMFNENLPRAQEHEFNLRLLSKGIKYHFLPEYCALIRQHNSIFRISNQNLLKTKYLDLELSELFFKYANDYSILTGNDNKLYIDEIIRFIIFRAQQFTNISQFDIVQYYENKLKVILSKYNYDRYPFYRNNLYSFFLNYFGLKNAEKIRFFLKNTFY